TVRRRVNHGASALEVYPNRAGCPAFVRIVVHAARGRCLEYRHTGTRSFGRPSGPGGQPRKQGTLFLSAPGVVNSAHPSSPPPARPPPPPRPPGTRRRRLLPPHPPPAERTCPSAARCPPSRGSPPTASPACKGPRSPPPTPPPRRRKIRPRRRRNRGPPPAPR